MAQKFLSDIHATAGIKDSSGDLGTSGQVLSSTGAGTNWVQAGSGATVIYDDQFIATANQTVFTLSNTVDAENKTQVYIDGAYQAKAGYTVSGTTLTFDTGLAEYSEVEVITFATALASNAAAVIRLDEFTGNNSTTDFALAQGVTDEKVTQVYINGVYQHKDTYSITDVTLTFSTAPPTSADIEVITFDTLSSSGEIQASSTALYVKNTSGSTIDKGTPVYITGSVGNSNTLTISPANASNASHMPSTGLLLTTLANNSFGYIITNGFLKGLTTNTIDGTSTSSNDTIYVKAGGGLTMTKPTGTNLIQNIGKVARSSGGNSGSILVSSILRSNDIPNIASGKIWVGDSNAVATERSLSGDATLSNTGALTLGTVPITKGGTGATSASAAKTALSLDNLDNTSDANKPVSTAGQAALDLKANIAGPTFTGDTGAANLTLSGYLRGPASFVIDPAAHGNNTGTLVVAGNLQVDGTTTTINSTTVSIDDLNFSIATDASDSAAANGAGITIGGAGASLTYSHSGTKFVLNKPLDVTGAGTFSGNVGIGMTPSKLLDLQATDNLAIRLYNSTTFKAGIEVVTTNGDMIATSAVNDLAIRSQSNILFSTGGNTERLRISSGGDATFSGIILLDGTNQIYFEPQSGESNTEGMRILRSADKMYFTYGINANEEAFYFDSSGDVTFSGNVSLADTKYIQLNNTSTDWRLRADNAGRFVIQTSVGSEFFKISSGGDVTITQPTNGSDAVLNLTSKSSVGNSRTSSLTYDADTENLIVNNAGTNAVTISSGGNVGIGTTSPSEAIEVKGNDKRISVRTQSGEGGFRWKNDAGTNMWDLVHNNSTGSLHLKLITNSTIPLTVKYASGDVGIGASSPSAKLHIVGDNTARNTLKNILIIDGGAQQSNPYGPFAMGIKFIGRDYGNAIRDYGYITSRQSDHTSNAGGGDPGFTSTLDFYTNSGGASSTLPTRKMVITPSGAVTKPLQPSWCLRPNGGGNANISSATFVGWSDNTSGSSSKAVFKNNVTLNGSTGGIHGAASTGRLTVPVAGKYQIYTTVRMENSPIAGNIYLHVNGTIVARQHVEVWGRYNYAHGFLSLVLNLSANDYIEVQLVCNTGIVAGYNDTVNWFSGHLIG